jgi:hypothetical protein
MPPLPIAIDGLADQLLARRTGTDDYSISVQASGGRRLTVGRIMRVARASGRVPWFWSITGIAEPEASIEMAGEGDTLDEAKAAMRQAFDRLLYWAALARSGELRWHVGEESSGAP